MHSKQIFRIQNISFSFTSGEPLFSDLSAVLHEGQRVAIVGANGCGKSTLLKILNSDLPPSSGELYVDPSRRFISQHEGSPILSGGQARIAELREAFAQNSELLLLDEPSNDLDLSAKSWLATQLRTSHSALLIVSHDPDILDLVDEIWELKHGKIVKHPAGYQQFVSQIEKEERFLEEKISTIEHSLKTREQEVRKSATNQEKRMARGKKSGIKQNLPKIVRGAKKRQAQKTLSKTKAVHQKRVDDEKRELFQAKQRKRELSLFTWDSAANRPPQGKTICEIHNFSLNDKHSGLSFSLQGPKKIHLKGKNGSGKSTLLKALAGNLEAQSRCQGKFSLTAPAHLFDQRLERFASDEALWKWFSAKTGWPITESRQLLGRLAFEQTEQERPVKGLSGGEKIRIELCLCANSSPTPQLLLLDEPTNHLDLNSRKILIDFINRFEGGLVVVSHDWIFLDEINFDQTVNLDN